MTTRTSGRDTQMPPHTQQPSGESSANTALAGQEQNQGRALSAPRPIGSWLTRSLALTSLGLGATCLLAPGWLASSIGLRDTPRVRRTLRLTGLREIVNGFGLLSGRATTGWLWSRVGGDAMDLAVLGNALTVKGAQSQVADRSRATGAMVTLAGIAALDVASASAFSFTDRATALADGEQSGSAITVHETVTINRPAGDLYPLWRNLSNLPRIMSHLVSVEQINDKHSHWKATAPAGATVEWDAEIVEDRPNELIAWRALPDAQVPNAGSVRFVSAPGDRGTEVHVELRYDPPAGKLGKVVAKLFGEEPSQQISVDLRRFKQVVETGEVARSDASIQGKTPKRHPAQPPKQPPADTQPELTISPSDQRARQPAQI